MGRRDVADFVEAWQQQIPPDHPHYDQTNVLLAIAQLPEETPSLPITSILDDIPKYFRSGVLPTVPNILTDLFDGQDQYKISLDGVADDSIRPVHLIASLLEKANPLGIDNESMMSAFAVPPSPSGSGQQKPVLFPTPCLSCPRRPSTSRQNYTGLDFEYESGIVAHGTTTDVHYDHSGLGCWMLQLIGWKCVPTWTLSSPEARNEWAKFNTRSDYNKKVRFPTPPHPRVTNTTIRTSSSGHWTRSSPDSKSRFCAQVTLCTSPLERSTPSFRSDLLAS